VAKFVASQFFPKGASEMMECRKEGLQRLARISAMVTGMVAVLVMLGFSAGVVAAADDYKPWVAPDSSRGVKNPVPSNPQTLAAAQQTFSDNCVQCHGEQGKGDGDTGKILKVKPANFTDPKLMALETDGSLFWKMSEGRGPMPSWKADLSETERWQLVNYIRKLGKDAAAKK
jgi:mono/diheme cytochrome c family protein